MLTRVALPFIFELIVVCLFPLSTHNIYTVMLPNLAHISVVLLMKYLRVLFKMKETDKLFFKIDGSHVNNFKTRIRKGYFLRMKNSGYCLGMFNKKYLIATDSNVD